MRKILILNKKEGYVNLLKGYVCQDKHKYPIFIEYYIYND